MAEWLRSREDLILTSSRSPPIGAMSQMPFFGDQRGSDPAYVNTRDVDNCFARRGRENCERLWEIYEPYADPDFLTEIADHFDTRYWEMYLTVSLIEQGYEVSCPKPGPDVGVVFNGARIWFEATCPTRGADGALDQVPEHQDGVVKTVPNEKMALRYLNSISDKYHRQYAAWIKNGIVKRTDAFVIAINPRQLGFEFGDANPPRILQAAFAIGNPYAAIDPKTMKIIKTGYQFRDSIQKASGATVPTGVFHQSDYAGLSGLLCSRVDVATQPEKLGTDFQLVPNPKARAPLWTEFRLRGTYFRIDRTDDGYVAVPEMIDA
jgi:hypothetical protein